MYFFLTVSWKMVDYSLQVGSRSLPQVKEFRYLGVRFTSEGRMNCETERRMGSVSAVLQKLYRIVVKRELSWKAKLSIYQSTYAPTFTKSSPHEIPPKGGWAQP